MGRAYVAAGPRIRKYSRRRRKEEGLERLRRRQDGANIWPFFLLICFQISMNVKQAHVKTMPHVWTLREAIAASANPVTPAKTVKKVGKEQKI